MGIEYSKDGYGAGLYSAIDTSANTLISSWSFVIDGHPFILVKLGTQGTYVYDISTGEWTSWDKEGCVGLGFQDGQMFDEYYIMGDSSDNILYSFDPNELDDHFGSFTSVVTGGIMARGRDSAECFAINLSGNLSDQSGRAVTLLTSDDNGKTWTTHAPVYPASPSDDITWRSLGLIKSPGRLFTITDDGALLSFDALRMTTDGS